jgi:hypothetical protein
LAKNSIAASSRIYTKEGKTKGFQADPFSKKPTDSELYADYQKFLAIEKDFIQKLRDTERECNDILEVLLPTYITNLHL